MTSTTSAETGETVDHNRSRLENGDTLERISFRATDAQVAEIDALVDDGEYHTRSELLRAAIRLLVERHERDIRTGR